MHYNTEDMSYVFFVLWLCFVLQINVSPAERCVISVLASVRSICSPEVFLGDNKSPHITFALNQPTT